MTERFWSKVSKQYGKRCWPWKASRDRDGYGQFKAERSRIVKRSNRVAWELTYGAIPPGMKVCHHCDNPACCRPTHLFLSTQQGNMLDRARKGRIVKGVPRGTTLRGMMVAEGRRKRAQTEA